MVRHLRPGGTPAPVVPRVKAALAKALATKDVIDGIADVGLEVGNLAPCVYAASSARDPQQAGALRYVGASAPRPVAIPGPTGPNDERIPLTTG